MVVPLCGSNWDQVSVRINEGVVLVLLSLVSLSCWGDLEALGGGVAGDGRCARGALHWGGTRRLGTSREVRARGSQATSVGKKQLGVPHRTTSFPRTRGDVSQLRQPTAGGHPPRYVHKREAMGKNTKNGFAVGVYNRPRTTFAATFAD